VAEAIKLSGFFITEVVSGTASGVDILGERWARLRQIPVKRFPANWSLGKRAGYLRNVEMACYAEAVIVVWDGVSRGSKHMIDIAHTKKLKVFIYNLRENNGRYSKIY
jgi:glycerophosphoryl diester phosphodiesterase